MAWHIVVASQTVIRVRNNSDGGGDDKGCGAADQTGLDWTRLDWIRLDWTEVNSTGLDWTGKD